MEAGKRNIKSGIAYDHLFPKARMRDTRVKRGAVLEDTINFIPVAVQRTRWQTQDYVDQELRGLSVHDACEKLWNFLYNHIQYKKDKEGREQIRSPGRSWHDRFGGIDCDCYTTFISTVLTNLNIPHTLRIAKYDPLGRFQHIYPIVPLSDGSYLTVDCVLNEFNKEQPYVEIKDTIMDLEFLDGIENESTADDDLMLDLEDIYGLEDLYGDDELGFSFKNTLKKVGGAIKKGAKAVGSGIKTAAVKTGSVVKLGAKAVGTGIAKGAAVVGKGVKSGVHYMNKINPATLLLRNGLLAAMKLNMFNVASNLRWSYLNEADVSKHGIKMSSYKSLKSIREKLQGIFYAAGGEESNLKKAILTGNGNKGREVSGLDGIENSEFFGLDGMDENTPLSQLLGPDIFYSENLLSGEELEGLMERERLEGIEIDGLNGLDDGEPLIGLGEPATVSIAAASGAMATIAALIKNVGNIFETGKKTVETSKSIVSTVVPSGQGKSSSPIPTREEQHPAPSQQPDKDIKPNNSAPVSPIQIDSGSGDNSENDGSDSGQSPQSVTPGNTELTVPQNTLPATANAATPQTTGFWDKNKTWLKPTLIGVAGLSAAYIGYRVISGSGRSEKKYEGLSGVARNKQKKRKAKNKHKGRKKSKPITKIKLSY